MHETVPGDWRTGLMVPTGIFKREGDAQDAYHD